MHAAPSVSYPVGRSRFAGLVLAGLWLLALAGVVLWTLQSDAAGWRQALGGAALVAAGAWAGLGWLRSATGILSWEAGGWQWEEGAATHRGQPEIALDLQSRLLLRWAPETGGRRWFWVERKAAPAHWDALRRAVYSRASPAPPQAAKPPVAKR
jgi:toxin CptA